MNYYLAKYQWIDNAWEPPRSTIGSIDLRNQSQMGTPITQDGLGFFVTPNSINGDLLGRGNIGDIDATPLMKSTWNSLLGYTPKGEKLSDLLYDHLTMGSDPTGVSASKPLCPINNNLELRLNGLIKRKQFRLGHSQESNQVISVLQNDYRRIREDVFAGRLPVDHHRKVLDFWGEQFRVNPDIFIPGDLPKETRLPHDTSLSENFDGADNAAVGKQLTWVEPGDLSHWDNFNNAARVLTESNTDNDFRSVYANSALSSADQQVITTVTVQVMGTNDASGITCRRSSSAVTYYRLIMRITQNDLFIQKVVTGTATTIGSFITISTSIPDTIKLEVIGSALESFFNGTSKDSITDTAITGNLFCGLFGQKPAGMTAPEMDDWSAQDISPPAPSNDGAALLAGLLE